MRKVICYTKEKKISSFFSPSVIYHLKRNIFGCVPRAVATSGRKKTSYVSASKNMKPVMVDVIFSLGFVQNLQLHCTGSVMSEE